MELINKHKTKLKWLYCILVAIPISTYILESASEEDLISTLVFTAIGLLIISLVIIDCYDLAIFLGASLSSWFIYGMTWSQNRLPFELPLWIASILAIIYRSYRKRKKLSLLEELLHLAGAVGLLVFSFYQYAIADLITAIIGNIGGITIYESEGLLRPALRYMPIFLIACYSSKSIWGYATSILVCYRSWGLVNKVYGTDEKLDFNLWVEDQKYLVEHVRTYVDKMLETGIFAIKFLGALIAVRMIIFIAKKIREADKNRKPEENLFNLCLTKLTAYIKNKLHAYDFKKKFKPLLKLYVIIAVAVLVYVLGFWILDGKDRREASKRGFAGYNFAEYEETFEVLEDIEFKFNTQTQQYVFGEDRMDLYDDGERRLFFGYFNNVFDYCSLHITSYGYADYWKGSYISLDDVEDVIMDTQNGRVKMELVEKTEFEYNQLTYRFKIYPLDEMSIQEFENLDLDIVLKGAKIMYYER